MPTKNNSPNLDQYIPEGRKRYVSYYEGAQMYGLAYTGFVKACKEAGANKKIRKTVMVDLDIVPAHILQNIESRNIGAVHPISLFLQFSQCFT
mgnify:CR=1 FL=1